MYNIAIIVLPLPPPPPTTRLQSYMAYNNKIKSITFDNLFILQLYNQLILHIIYHLFWSITVIKDFLMIIQPL